jgi:hypothetical protein
MRINMRSRPGNFGYLAILDFHDIRNLNLMPVAVADDGFINAK